MLASFFLMVADLGLPPYGRGGQGSLPLCELAPMPLAPNNNITFGIEQDIEGSQMPGGGHIHDI